MQQDTFYIVIIVGVALVATILMQGLVIKGLKAETERLNSELDYMSSQKGRHEIARQTIANGWQ